MSAVLFNENVITRSEAGQSPGQEPECGELIESPVGNRQTPLSPIAVCLCAVLGIALLIARKPDAVLDSQFYGEDGVIFFKDAHELGIASWLKPQAGYLVLYPRVIASIISAVVPTHSIPLGYAFAAIIIQILPALVIWGRYHSVIQTHLVQVLGGFALLLLPGVGELHATLVSSQWHLALATFLLLVAPNRPAGAWRAAQILLTFLSSFTGPFVLFILPVVVALYLYRARSYNPEPLDTMMLSILCMGAFVQGVFVTFLRSATRQAAPLGMSTKFLSQIIAGQIVIASFLGEASYRELVHQTWWAYGYCHYLISLLVVTIFIGSLANVSSARLGVISFAGLGLLASLLSPTTPAEVPAWEILTFPGAACRYWFLPFIALASSVAASVLSSRCKFTSLLRTGFFSLAALSILANFRYPALPPSQHAQFAKEFDQAPSGQRFTLPIQPSGFYVPITK